MSLESKDFLSQFLNDSSKNRNNASNQDEKCVRRIREAGKRASIIYFNSGQRIKGFPYIGFVNFDFHPREGLTMTYTSAKVILTGKNLLKMTSDFDQGKITHISIARRPFNNEEDEYIDTIQFEMFEEKNDDN